MRLNYLQNGGHDQNVLNRFTEMEYNARFKQANNARIPTGPKFGIYLFPKSYKYNVKQNNIVFH